MLPRPGNDGERAEDEVDQHERGGGQQQAEGGSQHCAPGFCNDIYQLKILSSNRRTLCYHAHLAWSSLFTFSWATVSQHFCSIFTDFRVQNCQASECAVRKSDNMENASHNLHKLTQVVQPVGAYPCAKNLGMPLLEDEWLILLRSLRGEVLCLVLASSQSRETQSLECSPLQSPI